MSPVSPASDLRSTRAAVDLSRPDNTELVRGRPFAVEALWILLGLPLLRSGLLPISGLKCMVLRLFGARIGRSVLIKPGVRVKFPWYLSVGDHCWLGEDLWIDNLAPVTIGSNVCLSQQVYICTGNHDWSHPNLKLFRRSVVISDESWVGARSTVCPGVTIGVGAVVTAASLVVRDVPAWEVHSGNPASFVKDRHISEMRPI